MTFFFLKDMLQLRPEAGPGSAKSGSEGNWNDFTSQADGLFMKGGSKTPETYIYDEREDIIDI